MVKLRGINLFPHAIAALIENRSDLTGEYVCHLRRDASGRDDMVVTIESRGGSDAGALAEVLRRGLGGGGCGGAVRAGRDGGGDADRYAAEADPADR